MERPDPDQLTEAAYVESARLFHAERWIGPIGSGGAAVTVYWVLVDLVDDRNLRLWLGLALIAAVLQALAFVIPQLRRWTTRRHLPVMTEVAHVAVGTVAGTLGLVDLNALADDRAVQMACTSYVFAMIIGVTIGTPTIGPLALGTVAPMWIGTILAFVLAGQYRLASGLVLLVGLLAHGWRADRRFRLELVELRAAADAEAEHRRNQAYVDSLTGVLNRGGLEAHIEGRYGGVVRASSLAAIFIDLDRFKPVNDAYGHAAGDEVLVAVAERLQSACRPDDSVARIGGDEFVIIVELDGGDDRAVHQVSARVAELVSEPISLSSGDEVSVTASVGIAVANGATESIDDLLKRADEAMYQVKRLRAAEAAPVEGY